MWSVKEETISMLTSYNFWISTLILKFKWKMLRIDLQLLTGWDNSRSDPTVKTAYRFGSAHNTATHTRMALRTVSFPSESSQIDYFKNRKPKITTEKPEITRAAYRSCISVFQKLITEDMRADLPPKTSGINSVQEYYKQTFPHHARNNAEWVHKTKQPQHVHDHDLRSVPA